MITTTTPQPPTVTIPSPGRFYNLYIKGKYRYIGTFVGTPSKRDNLTPVTSKWILGVTYSGQANGGILQLWTKTGRRIVHGGVPSEYVGGLCGGFGDRAKVVRELSDRELREALQRSIEQAAKP